MKRLCLAPLSGVEVVVTGIHGEGERNGAGRPLPLLLFDISRGIYLPHRKH